MDPNDKTPTTPPADAPAPVTPPTPPETPAAEPTPATPPVAPATPVAPTAPNAAPAAPNGSPIPTSGNGKKPKIGLILGIIGGVFALMIVALGVILGLAFNSVSKKDYADAVRQYNKVSQANSQAIRDLSLLQSTLSTSTNSFSTTLDSASDSFNKMKAENETLGKMKAVKSGDGKKVYDAFNAKLQAYINYGDELVTSLQNAKPALTNCNASSAGTTNEARLNALKKCRDGLNSMGDIPSAEFKSYLDTLKTAYSDYISVYESLAALTEPYGAQYDQFRALSSKATTIQTTVRTAATDLKNALNKKDDEMSVKEQADALAKFLNDKQRG